MRLRLTALLALACIGLTGCGYNTIQSQDEAVKAAWSEVVNQYQRRADLIPNLVNTVKGFAAQEQTVLIGVTEARARATSIQVTPETLNDPATLKRFQEAQGQLTSALSRLIAVQCTQKRQQVGAIFGKSPRSRHVPPVDCRYRNVACSVLCLMMANGIQRSCRPFSTDVCAATS